MKSMVLIGGGLAVMFGLAALIACQSVHWFAFGWPVVR
jgi:hypothetical protein